MSKDLTRISLASQHLWVVGLVIPPHFTAGETEARSRDGKSVCNKTRVSQLPAQGLSHRASLQAARKISPLKQNKAAEDLGSITFILQSAQFPTQNKLLFFLNDQRYHYYY
ncbi:hypothetical protein KIL84_021557 [Mauremys mutica]|uniref:Uncharacterized protein n=1 Tax=Mauremys mutica TaxID=74926 RepID=A0A9D3X8W6_9SAUR|nr:hypothetical protein KIL84_021557 [Mauremys mutica]